MPASLIKKILNFPAGFTDKKNSELPCYEPVLTPVRLFLSFQFKGVY
jgi:hypothetical protein